MRRVVVAVEPRLLADALVRALQRADANLMAILDSDAERGGAGPFDVAVIMDELPAGVSAHVVVRLAGVADMTEGSVTTPQGTQPAPVSDFAGLLETLNRLLGRI